MGKTGVLPTPICQLFQIHGSIFKSDPSRDCGQTSVVCIASALFHWRRTLLCRGNFCTSQECSGMFAFRHGPWLCAVVFLPVDKYMCRLWGRSDTPMVYIVLASRCIWYRVKWVLFHRPRSSSLSTGFYSRHPLLETEHCTCGLLRHTPYPMLRCHVHCLRLLPRPIQILCCHRPCGLHRQTAAHVRP